MTPHRIVGRCEVFAPIGEGGMANVYIGRSIGAGGFARTVAVKQMHKQFAKDPAFCDMFLDEARVVARIRHPSVVPTLDLIEEDGELFIVMEYVEGDTLAHLMKQQRRSRRPPIGVTLSIVSAALHGLHAAHQARDSQNQPMNLVHRDVTPHNILVGTDGYARLMDFGVARALNQVHSTKAGHVKGKPGYLAPEQILGDPLDGRTDVFSAAVVLWRSLTGKRLFKASRPLDVAQEVLHKEIDPPSDHGPKVPPKLDAIVLRGLERDPDKRWQSALEMANAIEALHLSATPRDVGLWVREQGRDELRRRADLISKIEQAPIHDLAKERTSTLPVFRPPTTKDKAAAKPLAGDGKTTTEADGATPGEARPGGPAPGKTGRTEPKSPADSTPEEPSRRDSAAPALAPQQKRRRQLLAVGGAALALGVVAGLVALTGNEETSAEKPATTAQPGGSQAPPTPDSATAPTASTAGAAPTTGATAMTSAEVAEPAPSATASTTAEAAPSASPSASSAPSATKPTGLPRPSIYGRE